MIRYYYRYCDGAVMKRFEDSLICHCIDRLADPCISYRMVFTRQEGYCIERDLLLGCHEISKAAFLDQLSHCDIICKPSAAHPLPRWFHVPTPSGHVPQRRVSSGMGDDLLEHQGAGPRSVRGPERGASPGHGQPGHPSGRASGPGQGQQSLRQPAGPVCTLPLCARCRG